MEKTGSSLHCWWEFWKATWQFLMKLKVHFEKDTAVLLLLPQREEPWCNLYRKFTGASFVTTKSWKWLIRSSTGGESNGALRPHSESYLEIKRIEWVVHVAVWMVLQGIMLSEKSLSQMVTCTVLQCLLLEATQAQRRRTREWLPTHGPAYNEGEGGPWDAWGNDRTFCVVTAVAVTWIQTRNVSYTCTQMSALKAMKAEYDQQYWANVSLLG